MIEDPLGSDFVHFVLEQVGGAASLKALVLESMARKLWPMPSLDSARSSNSTDAND